MKQLNHHYYVPVLPMILINGCKAGIGTGWSTSIPCYNPKDIASIVLHWIDNKSIDKKQFKLMPYYNGFTW